MLRWFCRWGRGGVWVSLAEREAGLCLGISFKYWELDWENVWYWV